MSFDSYCIFVFFVSFAYKIDMVMAEGAPHPLPYQFYIKRIQKIQKYNKNQMTHTQIQQKSNDSLHLLRFGRLKTDLKT